MTATHDYRDDARGWGHDLTYEPLNDDGGLRATGWGRNLRVGDYMLLSNGATDTRYMVTAIEYRSDPPDMWRAVLAFAPRHEEVASGETEAP